MIHNMDRSGWFGCSDTKYIMAENQNTKSWIGFWSEKLGAPPAFTGNRYTQIGTMLEHPVIDAIDEGITKDGQIIIEDLRIRANYDGYKDGCIYEIKCHPVTSGFKVTNPYWMQCQAEMIVYMTMCSQWFLPEFQTLYLVDYGYTEEEANTALAAYPDGDMSKVQIDPGRINKQIIPYDEKFAKKYLRRVSKLAKKLKKEME